MAVLFFADAVESFLLACAADGLSGASIKWYRNILTNAATRWADLTIDEVTVGPVRQYFAELRSRGTRRRGSAEVQGGVSVETLRAHIRALRRFFAWSCAEYALDPATNPMLRIRMPPRPRQAPKAIALADLRKLLDACGTGLAGTRDRAMLLFLADTGCRAAGMLSLRPEDLNLEHGRAILREKGDRSRVVPFTRYTAEALRRWMEARPPMARTVFCGMSGEYYGEPLRHSGLSEILRRLKVRAGVTGRVNPHSFRHGFAREYLRNGGDLATLARLMGHSSVEVTASFYAVFTDPELAQRHELFSPIRSLESTTGGAAEGDESESRHR